MRRLVEDVQLEVNLATQAVEDLTEAVGDPQQSDPLLDQIAALAANPGVNAIVFFKQADGNIDWLEIGSNLSITGNILNATGGGAPGADSVTNTELANMATKTYKGRTAAGTGDPEDIPVATLKADLGLVKSDVGLSNVDNTSDAAKFTDTPLTGNPTAPTQTAGNNTTRLATTAFVATALANLIASAPGALDTLDELAAAMGDDANFATTMTNALAGKQPLDADLTAIAALSTTSYGRALLALVDAADLTALLNNFTSALKGLVPPSGGGTANYLRADGGWAEPPGTGGALTYANGTAGSDVTMTNANQFYTGTSVSITAGTWLIVGHITIGRTATTLQRYTARIRNTTDAADLASSQMTQPSQNPHYINICISTIVVVASGTKTIEIQAAATSTNCVIKAAAADNPAGNTATQLNAVKIG